MSSLFDITNELESIFYEIEENGGEITPEIEAKLALTEDNFKDKCKGYVEAIKHLDNDVNACKNETKRIKDFSISKLKNKERLSKALIDAILNFGESNKYGNKFIDLETTKIQVRESKETEVNESLVQEIINSFFRYCNLAYDNSTLGLINFDEEEVVEFINEDIKNNIETSYLLFIGKDDEDNSLYKTITLDDFRSIMVNMNTSINLFDLCKSQHGELIKGHINADFLSEHKPIINKTFIKNVINDGAILNIAKFNTNLNLNIK